MLTKAIIYSRLKNGWSEEKAYNTPPIWTKKLTIEKVDKVNNDKLTICSAAYLLGVTSPSLSSFIKRHNIKWKNKGFMPVKGDVMDGSTGYYAKKYGLCRISIYKYAKRKNVSYEQAAKIIKQRKDDLTARNEKIISLSTVGITRFEAARRLGIKPTTLISFCNTNGVVWLNSKGGV